MELTQKVVFFVIVQVLTRFPPDGASFAIDWDETGEKLILGSKVGNTTANQRAACWQVLVVRHPLVLSQPPQYDTSQNMLFGISTTAKLFRYIKCPRGFIAPRMPAGGKWACLVNHPA